MGNKISMIDANGKSTQFAYDEKDQLVHGDICAQRHIVSLRLRCREQQDPDDPCNSHITNYIYDAINLLT